jgi:hypothetical protein
MEAQWSSVREEWASERGRLTSARFDARLIILQQQQYGIGNGEVVKGFSYHQHGNRGGLVTPPSL